MYRKLPDDSPLACVEMTTRLAMQKHNFQVTFILSPSAHTVFKWAQATPPSTDLGG
jgi:hypothetical protein